MLSITILDDDYEVYSLVKRGKVWDRFKPLEAERLYYDILNSDVDNLEVTYRQFSYISFYITNRNSFQEVVVETLNTIKTQEYLYSMMCLILDLADYQTYELPKYKTYSIKECKQILQDLLKTGPNHQVSYKINMDMHLISYNKLYFSKDIYSVAPQKLQQR